MNHIYLGKVEKFVKEKSDIILDIFKDNFKESYGEYPDIEQLKAWKSSINYLKTALDDKSIHEFALVFEYKLPFSNERIDLLIFGKHKTKPTILLFELKGWQRATKTSSPFIVECDLGKAIHSEYQVENYAGKLRFSHSEAEKFNILPAVLMYNAIPQKVNLEFKKPVFFRDDIQDLRKFITDHLQEPLDSENIYMFLNGQYIQSNKLFDAIKKHFEKIKDQSYLALAENGWGLSSEQLELIEEIISDLESDKENIVYLVQGAPGSGKTLVAIHLLLSALKNNYKAILAYRNNRLINSIREVFDSIERGLSTPIKFYSTGPRAGFRGVAEQNFNGPYLDIVIYDEAQRMTEENIRFALERGKITIFFYDEGQILNAEEKGTTENFIKMARRAGKTIKERFLRGFYRVEGGEQYHKFVETLLREPEKISNTLFSWKNHYDFKVFETINELLNSLTKRKEEKFKVALIAAFTESPGDLRNNSSIRNLRIGHPLYSGLDIYKHFTKKIYWLMDPKNDYVPFWVKGDSNKLDKCASIYGCQGFETDFAGVIWGRDFVYRNGRWKLGENCEDNIAKPSLKDIIKKAQNGDNHASNLALTLLINRYRIFLTRGIKGKYIFCEDPETADFLRRVYNNFVA
ncbi:MAG TPA: DUF2075 domain-containing protein [Defluviitoga tunisiensis]|nr:DUF2075 domain-containing protein [Defluviitoga tunisiensis]HPP11042.1 DUF2075 domain-containing protein [Defluviitoga tunisiensis]